MPKNSHRDITIGVNNNKKSQNNLGKAASPPLTAVNNYATKSPLTTSNGTQIQSVVLPQYTLRTNRPIDKCAISDGQNRYFP